MRRETLLTAALQSGQHVLKDARPSDKADRTQVKDTNKPHILDPWETIHTYAGDVNPPPSFWSKKQYLTYLASSWVVVPNIWDAAKNLEGCQSISEDLREMSENLGQKSMNF